jgi:hypothetical protein
MKDIKLKGIYIEIEKEDGSNEMVSIRDLDRPDYEQFLEMMHGLRLAYITSMRKLDNGDERD